MPDRHLDALATRLQALANPMRLRILLVLRDGAMSVCQIAAVLDVPASGITSHLAELKRAGIVGENRRGRFAWYALHRQDDVVPWLRLVARHSEDDAVVLADHRRAKHIRFVPPELLVTSIECDAGIAPEAPSRRLRSRGAA
jgi:ArsR family transcriptional regulator